ncbi:hypothetical protein ABMA57_11015 [Saccharospirillum sp. HFRX-1]|uniref:hypothetical protein n=1 Tax=unclassified Saccharospirillum TaxID=2633430 RepID=UPI00372309D0
MVSLTPLLRPAALACLTAALCACSQDDTGSGSGKEQLYRLAGLVELGRPGQWAEVCINNDCTRANNTGNYRFDLPLNASQLVRAAVPESNGDLVWLTSFYRHAPNLTDRTVNLNPTTTALIEAWSKFHRNRSLDACLVTAGCEEILIDSFTPVIQGRASGYLNHYLANAWTAPTDPFGDIYLADPDPEQEWLEDLHNLDDLHDHFNFEATNSYLAVTDNNGGSVGNLSYYNLFLGNAPPTPLSSTVIQGALDLAPNHDKGDSAIKVIMKVTPGSSFNAPRTIGLSAYDSYSSQGSTLTFDQELVAPDGSVTRSSAANFSPAVTQPGPHSWVVSVSDELNNRSTLGMILQVGSDNPLANPTFGASGSCLSNPINIDANTLNICEESLDGSLEYGQCIPVSSGSTTTIPSPGRCSPTSQNGGALLGVCTELDIELRVFFYENVYRDTGESLSAQRNRRAEKCRSSGYQWSNQPEN